MPRKRNASEPPTSKVSAARRLTRFQGIGLAPDDPRVLDARRDHATEQILEYVQRVVAAAPPLRPCQIDRLRALLGSVPVEPAKPDAGSRGAA